MVNDSIATSGAIRPLPAEIVAQIECSSIINSLTEIVIGLTCNALDAESTKIEIDLDFQRGTCVVEDNGCGIPSAEFLETGGLGKQYWSSKFGKSGYHGGLGTFLFSVATLAILTITSRQVRHKTLNSIILGRFESPIRRLPASKQDELLLCEHGTRVTVQKLFRNVPVRAKQMEQFNDPLQNAKEFEKLKCRLLALLLAWSRPIHLSLRDERHDLQALLRTNLTSQSALGSTLNRNSGEELLDLRHVLPLLKDADIAPQGASISWIPISAKRSLASIRGLICLEPVPTKQAQFISIGVHPIYNFDEQSSLYHRINSIFSNSWFGKNDEIEELTEAERDRRKEDRRFKQDGPTLKELKTASKGVDRWAMFCIQVKIQDQDAYFGPLRESKPTPEAIMTAISDLIEATVIAWLVKYRFLPPKRLKNQNLEHVESKTSAQCTDTVASCFESRIRANGKAQLSDAASLECQLQPSVIASSEIQESSFQLGNDVYFLWQQPSNGEKYHVNIRTGMVLPTERGPTKQIIRPLTAPSTSMTPRTIFSKGTKRPQTASESELVKKVLNTWRNPVFESTEQQIQRLHSDSALTESRFSVHQSVCEIHFGLDQLHLRSGAQLGMAQFRKVEVISQLDNKFILVKVQYESLSNHQLVLVDQHAADERCKLEELLQELCSSPNLEGSAFNTATGCESKIKTLQLQKPINFEISRNDAHLLLQHAGHFADWGILYDCTIPDDKDAMGHQKRCKITVSNLPPGISERCAVEHKILIDLLRAEIWSLNDSNARHVAKALLVEEQRDEQHPWLRRIGGCPKGIIDLLNSRACRSAVMFNDRLSIDECRDLIARLMRCAFPLLCAHGRPSMVGVAQMDVDGAIDGDWAASETFVEAYKRWMCL